MKFFLKLPIILLITACQLAAVSGYKTKLVNMTPFKAKFTIYYKVCNLKEKVVILEPFGSAKVEGPVNAGSPCFVGLIKVAYFDPDNMEIYIGKPGSKRVANALPAMMQRIIQKTNSTGKSPIAEDQAKLLALLGPDGVPFLVKGSPALNDIFSDPAVMQYLRGTGPFDPAQERTQQIIKEWQALEPAQAVIPATTAASSEEEE